MQSVKVTLMPQVLISGELQIDALGLKYHSNLAANSVGIFGRIVAHNDGASAGRQHQCRKNSKKGGFSAAIRSQQSEEFGWPHIEGDTVQRHAVVVTMNYFLYGNYCGPASRISFRIAEIVRGDFGGHRLFYSTPKSASIQRRLSIIIRANSRGK